MTSLISKMCHGPLQHEWHAALAEEEQPMGWWWLLHATLLLLQLPALGGCGDESEAALERRGSAELSASPGATSSTFFDERDEEHIEDVDD